MSNSSMNFAAEGVLRGAARTEILFIDSGVQGYQALIEGARPGLEVVVLSADLDGIAQIERALAGRSGVDAVHVISHGTAGSLVLGSGSIGLDDLDGHSTELATIGQALSEGADILLYGCDVAAGEAGRAFVARLAELTGADVAASDDLTGAAFKGGDWDLEAETGTIEAGSALSAEMQETYAYTLAPADQNFDSELEGYLNSAGETIAGVTYTLVSPGGFLGLTQAPASVSITPDASDLAVMFNYDGVVVQPGALDARIAAADGAEFRLVSMEIDTGAGQGTSSQLTITGYRDGAAVVGASDTIDTSNSDAGGSVTYVKYVVSGPDPDAEPDVARGGVLTFDSNWQFVDEIRITGVDTIVVVDELNFEAAVSPNAAPSATNLTHTVVYAEDPGASVALDNIVVTDADAGETITATLTLSNPAAGGLSVGTFGSATSTFNAGTGAWAVSGSVADVNLALAATAFTPAANWDRDVTIATRIRDAAGAGPADGVITLDVTAANDAPSATNLTQAKAAVQGGSSVALDDIAVVDVDTGDTVTATLTLSDPAAGTLSTGTFGSATSTFNAGTGVWTVAGSVADVNAALASAALTPSAGNAQDFSITTRIRDAEGAGPADGTISVTVTPLDTPPSVASVSVPANGSYAAGQTLSFTVTFDENVVVTGTDSVLGVTIGGAGRSAAFASKTANSITYSYTVQAGDIDADGVAVGGVTLGTSTIRDAGGADAVLTLGGHLPSTAGVLVDTAAPTVASVSVPANATYVAGQHLDFIVTFDENVIVSGSGSTLGLTIGSEARSATFHSSSGDTVTYRYTVQAGDIDGDGVSVGSLSLDGSAIRDAAGNNANLTLNSVGATTSVLVDADMPAVAGVIGVPANATYVVGDTLSFTVTFSENVTVTGTDSTLELMIGGAARSAIYDSKTANSITYAYTVQSGDNDGDGIAVGAISAGTSTIRDMGGNDASLALSGHVPATAGVLVDTAGPSFTSATVSGATLVMTYADAGLLDAAHAPAAGDFTVLAGGVPAPVTAVVVNAAAHTITLTLASPVAPGATVTVAYDDPSGSNDVHAIQDAAGNDAASLVATSVTNTTSPPTPPTPPPQTETVDGVVVQKVIGAGPGGAQIQTVTVPVIQPSRVEQVGDNHVADIPLVRDGSGFTLLGLQAPTGIGLTASGSTAPMPVSNALNDLIREIEARTGGGSQDQSQLTGGGLGFLGSLHSGAQLLVQTIVVAGEAGSSPLGIFGSAAGAVQSALVIDTTGLPDGAALELQNVDFAAVIGAATVTGGAGSQHVWGDGASQNIVLGAGDDELHGGAGDDTIGSKTGQDKLYGDEGDDTVFGGEENDQVFGGADADNVHGNQGDDFVHGNQGDDTVLGGQGDDLVYGGQGGDLAFGDIGNDRLYGDFGADTMQGNQGQDTLSGGEGDDLLMGGRDGDAIRGEAGDDFIWGDLGSDTLSGGAGADRFGFRPGEGADVITDFAFAQGDRIVLDGQGAGWTVSSNVGGDAVLNLVGGGSVVLIGVSSGDVTQAWFV